MASNSKFQIISNIKLILILIIIISSLFIILLVSYAFNNDIEYNIQTKQQNIIKTIDSYIEHDIVEKSKLITIFFKNSSILNSIKNNNDYQESITLFYKQYKSIEPSLVDIHIILNNKNSLEKNKKALVKKALESKKLESGFESGKISYLFKIIYPLFLNGEFLGVCEFSYHINNILSNIHKQYAYNLALILKEKNGSVIQYATPISLFKTLSILEKVQKRVTINDKIFSIFKYKLNDLENNSQLIALYDITAQVQRHTSKLYLLLLILIITSLAVILFVNYLKKKEMLVKTKNRELYFNSRHHKLTNLPNIDILFEDINLYHAETILALNADNIALMNVTYGYNVVNNIIKQTANNLKHNLPSNAKIYHVSIDEFIITLQKPSKNQETLLASQIKAYFEQLPIVTAHTKTQINFTIGIAIQNQQNSSKLDIYEHANIALLEAKQRGKGLTVKYDSSMSNFGSYTQLASNISILQNDLENGNLTPFYQPIINTYTKEILKYEVLARMENESGFISPDAFMKAAEVAGLQIVITKEMIQKSFKYFASTSTQFSINITKHDLLEEFLEEFLTLKTKTYNIDPKNVTLEILENIIIDNEKIVKQINRLGSLGYVIAIDDFGVESSNISRLTSLNAQYLKIDGSFIKDMNTNEKHHYIAESLVYMAHKLGMKIIAEYVHNEEIYEHAKLLGIDYVQGYYFSEPRETI